MTDLDPLWKHADDNFLLVLKSGVEDVRCRWAWGHCLCDLRQHYPIDTIAARYDLHTSLIRQHIQFAERFPTVELLDNAIKQHLDQHTGQPKITWTYVRGNMLPKRTRTTTDEKEADDNISGITGSAEYVAAEFEELAKHPPADGGQRRDAQLTAAACATSLQESARALGGEIEQMEMHNPPFVEMNLIDKHDIMCYQEWMRTTQPCLVCGVEGTMADKNHTHHFPKTKGGGGEDWEVLPLCPECHRNYHDLGYEYFIENFGQRTIRYLQEKLFRLTVSLWKNK